MTGLAKHYLRVHVAVHCKEKTAERYRFVLERHILPLWGELELGGEFRRDRVVELHDRLRETPNMADAVVGILSKMYRLAKGWELVPLGCNPCRSVRRYQEEARERFLTPEESDRLSDLPREALRTEPGNQHGGPRRHRTEISRLALRFTVRPCARMRAMCVTMSPIGGDEPRSGNALRPCPPERDHPFAGARQGFLRVCHGSGCLRAHVTGQPSRKGLNLFINHISINA